MTTKDIENEKTIISLKELQNETLKTMTSNIESIRNELNAKLDEKFIVLLF